MSEHTELGQFEFCYRTCAVHGFGFSASSNFAVTYAASQQFHAYGPPLIKDRVALGALRFERLLAGGLALAANDVYPICEGGAVKVLTPASNASGEPPATVVPIKFDARWIAEHVIVAFNKRGTRHDNPDLLGNLVRHKNAGAYVRQFSELAETASEAISDYSISSLANAVNSYRISFDQWTADAVGAPVYTKQVTQIAAEMEAKLRSKVLGWKPPGGGASESIIVFAADQRSRDEIITFFETRQWVAFPALATHGVCGEFLKGSPREVRIDAGHRLDVIGAADLGADESIQQAGRCCSLAIEPRSEILLVRRP